MAWCAPSAFRCWPSPSPPFLRRRLEPDIPDRLPRAAGRGLRADDPGLAGAADFDFPVPEARHGAGHLVDHDAGRPNLRTHPGWLHLRQLPLGMDLPD